VNIYIAHYHFEEISSAFQHCGPRCLELTPF